MSKIRTHRFIVIVLTISVAGLIAESFLEGWESWVNPLLFAGIISCWVLHAGQHLTEKQREAFYLGFGMFATLFHGVHATSLFDVCTIITLMFVIFSFYDRIFVLNMILIEYAFIMCFQFLFFVNPDNFTLDSLTISRICLQLVVVVTIYFVCRISVSNRLEQAEAIKKRDGDIESYDNDMDDFLSNISHELRTPVNVVNGMSMLLLKKDSGTELNAIRDAGMRLSNQIEDIQDYTEVKRASLVLEEENYMVTSVVNDLVADYRHYTEGNKENLELVIDLDPNVPAVLRGDIRKLKKILRHLTLNAIKFTARGGVYIKIYTTERKYGVNLCIEVTDTGVGMSRRDIAMASRGLYQANKKRNRSTGGIGLGLPIVYGMAHRMGGFVKIESNRGVGTMVRVTLPQTVSDKTPCLNMDPSSVGDILFHVRPEKYKVPAVRDFYSQMATNLAVGIRRPLYSADSAREVERLIERLHVSHIFMGEEEYNEDGAYFDELSKTGVVVAVSARAGFHTNPGSQVIVMPKPLYAVPVVRLLNGELLTPDTLCTDMKSKPMFKDVRALIVDDEPMNLVVASGMFKEYGMIVETAAGGREAIDRFERGEKYDIIFMDHMMPGMDGVEAMKLLKEAAKREGTDITVIALTANAVSGAREMFLNEGFDGFVAKPIDVGEFEHVMKRVLAESRITFAGGGAS